MIPYQGLLTAMVTPFDDTDAVNEDAAVALGRHLLRTGSDGLVLCATTGEPSTLSEAEKLGIFTTIVEELGDDGAIIANTSSNDTRQACQLTAQAAQAGAHAVLSVTPYYNLPNRTGLKRHFEEIAKAAGGTPVILYNNPHRTGLNMPPDLLAELAQIDGIEAVKQSNSDELQLIDGLAVLAGNDDSLARCLDMGGAGGICVASQIAGTQMKRLFEEPDKRTDLDLQLRPLYKAMFITASPAPVKAALNMLGHNVGGLRLPLVAVNDDEARAIRTALEQYGLLSSADAPPAVP